MSRAVLEARNLDFAYGGGPLAVRNASLAVSAGEMTALIGANGSGKSTLIRMLAGLLKPRNGKILLHGRPFAEWEPRKRAREIAYVPQTMPAVFPFPAVELVLSGRTPHTGQFHMENAGDLAKAMEALELAGAAHLAARPFTSLSGGERQMVTLARALAQEPRILLLDEPSSSLDLKHRAALIRTLSELRSTRGLSVAMITHDLQLLGAFDRVTALRCGAVACAGTPDEVLRDANLQDIYDDPNVRARRMGDQTLVWVEM